MDPVEQFLSRLQHPVMAGVDLKLDRMLRFLSLIGSPHKRVPPVIHVAGTNGKGSLIAYLQSIMQDSGFKVHRYISPHLVHFRERIVLQGKEVDNAYLQNLLGYVAKVLPQQPATFFEATTALGFLAFADKKADVLLLETGCGGRLDATNVIDKPLMTVITPVSFDHMEYLGTTLTSIAGEKAGIIKRGVPCVVGRQEAESLRAIGAKAAELEAPLIRLGYEFHVERRGEEYWYRSDKRELKLTPALIGDYQYDNAATAAACIEHLPQFSITDAQTAQGIAHAVWPGRLQSLQYHPFANILPQGIKLWLDGGHNPQGGEMLAHWLSGQGAEEIYLVCGMAGTKDSAAYLKPLAHMAKALYAVAIPDESMGKPPEQVRQAAAELGMEAVVAPTMENALQSIAARAKTPAIICICGSLYLAGKVLALQGE